MLLYPYYMGMGLHIAISALLFHGRVLIQNSGWISPLPLHHFAELANYMKSKNHYLHKHIDTMGRFYAYNAFTYDKIITEYSDELDGRITRLGMLAPCTDESYQKTRAMNFDKSDLLELKKLINRLDFYTIASIDFMFMAYELSLELGNMKDTCQCISEKVENLGGFENTLFDCLLHRIVSILPSIEDKNSNFLSVDITTDSKVIANLLNNAAQSYSNVGEELDSVDTKINIMAYRLFDGALNFFHERKHLATSKKLGNIFKVHSDSLEGLRTKCKLDAAEIIFNSNDSPLVIESKVKNCLSAYKKEVASMLSLKTNIIADSYKRITEDPVIWSAFLASIISLQVGAPAFLPTSAAITALSKAGVSILKSKREAQQRAKDSPLFLFSHLK